MSTLKHCAWGNISQNKQDKEALIQFLYDMEISIGMLILPTGEWYNTLT